MKIPGLSPYEMEIIFLSSSATAKCGWNYEQHLNVAGNYMITTYFNLLIALFSIQPSEPSVS